MAPEFDEIISAAEHSLDAGFYPSALKHYNDALALVGKSLEESILVHYFIGLVYLELNQLKQVEAEFNSCESIAQRLYGSSVRYAAIYADQARAYGLAGHDGLARERLSRFYEIIGRLCLTGEKYFDWNFNMVISVYELTGDWQAEISDSRNPETMYSYRAAYEAANGDPSVSDATRQRLKCKYLRAYNSNSEATKFLQDDSTFGKRTDGRVIFAQFNKVEEKL